MGKIDNKFGTLEEIVNGIAAVGECSQRTYDYVASFGELLSSAIVVGAFTARGLSASWVDPRRCLVTNAEPACAAPLFAETKERIVAAMAALLKQGRVSVFGGCVGAPAVCAT